MKRELLRLLAMQEASARLHQHIYLSSKKRKVIYSFSYKFYVHPEGLLCFTYNTESERDPIGVGNVVVVVAAVVVDITRIASVISRTQPPVGCYSK